jgi:hypothetical protein
MIVAGESAVTRNLNQNGSRSGAAPYAAVNCLSANSNNTALTASENIIIDIFNKYRQRGAR